MAKRSRTIYLVKRLETLVRGRLEAALQYVTLTPGQYTTLSVVKAGPISSADLARRVGITPQSMSEMIGSLERKDLIVKMLREDNRRIADIMLTDTGAELLAAADKHVDLLERELFAPLSPDQEKALRGALELILN